MKKKYITLILLFTLFLPAVTPAYAFADMPSVGMMDELAPSITVRGNQLTVQHAEGMVLEIYNLAGLKVGSFKVESSEQSISTSLPKGCYILKLGKLVRKISIG